MNKNVFFVLSMVLVLYSCGNKRIAPDAINMNAVKLHMGETKGNYTIVDKVNSTIYFYSNGKCTGYTWALMSSNIGDGYTVSKVGMDESEKARTSGCGVYTVSKITPRLYNNEPCVHLHNAKGKVVSTALHGPAGGKVRGTRRGGGSAGCPRLPAGKMKSLVKSGFFHVGDSVIIIPEEDGNFIYFENGKFHTVIKNRQQAEMNADLDIQYNEEPSFLNF